VCFSANQALLAAKAGATFISPFIGRLDDINIDGMELIRDIREIYDNYGFEPRSSPPHPHRQPCEGGGADRRRCDDRPARCHPQTRPTPADRTNQLHRAILKMLDADQFEQFVLSLGGEVAHVLRVEGVALVLESTETAALGKLEPVLKVRDPGFVAHYMAMGRNVPPRHIVLRQTVPEGADGVYGAGGGDLRSEVLLRLDLGDGRLPGMLAMASEDPHRFRPGQGTDLLTFFAGMFERVLRRWLG
jgi:uncharacterized protein YigA (DUF484 family)